MRRQSVSLSSRPSRLLAPAAAACLLALLMGCGQDPDADAPAAESPAAEPSSAESPAAESPAAESPAETATGPSNPSSARTTDVIDVEQIFPPVSEASLDPDSVHVLVNRQNPLEPLDYEPQDLRLLDVDMLYPDQQMREEPAAAVEELFAAAEEEGHQLAVTTAFRTFEHQQALYDQRSASWGEESADEYTARPGYSEHQTGLAVDITSIANEECTLGECFGDTPEGMWVAENAHEFGFIIRYPEEAEEITGYAYEPWHLRYVGIETAEAVFEEDITLEEFWDQPPAPEY